MEQILSQRKTRFESSSLFLFPFYTLIFLGFAGILFLFSPFLVVFPLILFLLMLDKLIWESKGWETILIDEEKLIVRRKPKIFNKEKSVLLRDIDMVEYRQQTFLESSWFGPSVSEWILYQEKLQINTIMGTKLTLGINLTCDERDEIIEAITERVRNLKVDEPDESDFE